jgi:hypothetical protein
MRGSFRVVHNVIRLIVLPAIDLDDQASFVAGEVCKVWTDRGLPPEVGAVEWQASKMPPESAFCFRHVATQSACAWNARVDIPWLLTRGHACPPPPTPPHHSQELAGGGERRGPSCRLCAEWEELHCLFLAVISVIADMVSFESGSSIGSPRAAERSAAR